MSLACLARVNFLLHMYFDLITEQINDDDDDDDDMHEYYARYNGEVYYAIATRRAKNDVTQLSIQVPANQPA